jgi:hypothetical protein
LNRVKCKAACRYCFIILKRRNIGINQVKKIGVVPARSIKSCSMQAVRQVVSTDVLIVGQLDGDGQSFAILADTK